MITTSRLEEEMERTARRVNDLLDSFVPEKEPIRLTRAARHLLKAGGKRLRPFVTIKACEAEGGTESKALPLACAVELLHNFTLVHDDIMDKDTMRRNVETVHLVYGEPIAILAGDYLLAKAFDASSDSSHLTAENIVRANQKLAQAMVSLAEGQALDTEFEHRESVSELEYIQMVRMKTASLYSAAAYVGGCAAGASQGDLEALASYGDSLGVAFQIRDDVLGLTSELTKLGKPVGSDVKKGKKTLVILKGLAELTPARRKKVLALMQSQKGAQEEIEQATQSLVGTGALAYADQRMHEYAERALSYLRKLHSSPERESLEACARFVVERSF